MWETPETIQSDEGLGHAPEPSWDEVPMAGWAEFQAARQRFLTASRGDGRTATVGRVAVPEVPLR